MKYYAFMILISANIAVFGQGGFDSVYYNPAFFQNSKAISMIQKQDGYSLIGTAQWFPAYMNVDLEGGLIDYENHPLPLGSYISLNDPVARCSDATYLPYRLNDTLFLTKFELDGEITWTRVVTADTNVYARKAVCVRDEFLMVVGGRGSNDPNFTAFLLTVEGDIVWQQIYPGLQSGTDVVFHPENLDGKFYVCGHRSQNNNDEGFLAQLDQFGTIGWIQNFGGPSSEPANGISVLGDMVIVAGNTDGPGQVIPRVSGIWRYDTLGSFMNFDPAYTAEYPGFSTFNDVVSGEDCFLACGIRPKLHPQDKGQLAYLVKYDSSGNILWERGFQHFHDTLTAFHPTFRNVQFHPDGGILVCGHERRNNLGLSDFPGFSSEHAWFMKLDSMGCLLPGCDDLGTLSVQEINGLDNVQVFPNPASHQLQWSLEHDRHINGPIMVTVVDRSGRSIESFTSTSITGTMDISRYPTGGYFVHFMSGDIWVGGAKFVVNK